MSGTTGARLAAIVEGSDDAIIETDLKGRIRHANPAVQVLFGYRPDELIGGHVRLLVPDDELPELTAVMQRVAEGDSSDTLATRRLCKDGRLIDTSLRLSAVRDHSGQVVGISGITRDISAEVATLARLQASEETFKARFYDSPVPQAMVDLQGRLLTVNDALCSLLGLSRAELEAKPLAELTHPSDVGSADERLNALLDGVRAADSWERIAARPDGSAVPVLVHAAVLRHPDGTAYALAAFVQDLTALRQAERALRRRESLFTALVEQASDWAVVIDATGRLLLITETFASTFGYQAADLVGRDGWEFVHPDDQPAVRAAIEETISTGDRRDGILFRIVDHHGRWRWIEQNLINRLGDADIAGIVSNGREVTARLEAEQALHASEALHRAIADAAQEGIWACNRLGRTLYANRKLADILGLTLPQLHELTAPELLDPDGVMVADRLRDRHDRGVEEYDLDYAHPDGALRRLHLSVSPLDDHSGPVGSLAMISDVTEAMRFARELRQRALYDELTGLPNRSLLCDRLDQALTRSQSPGGGPVAVLFANVDQFQLINNSWGHATGDLLLAEVARRLGDGAAATDTVARFAADGFVVLCEAADEVRAQQIASSIQRELGAPFELDGQRMHVSASIGIACTSNAGDGCDARQLLRFADTAMHSAKALGPGQVSVFDLTLAERASNRLRLANDLRDALESDQLDLHYQPIVELATGRVLGVEALARWHHRERGHISPAEFVSVAESQGFARQLDEWALARACRDMTHLRRELGPTATVSVNISAQHLAGSDLEAAVVSALQNTGLPAAALVLEITESAAMHDVAHARELLNRLRSRGVAVALDDFGTGYSSLAYLNRLPAATLKIDRAFVEHITDESDAFAIAAAVIDLARAMKLGTVAEGVETIDQLKLLRRLGCAAGQGWLWSRALPPAELVKKLRQLPHGQFNVHNRRSRGPNPPALRSTEVAEVSVSHGLQQMLRLHNEGASLTTIAAALNAEGFRTPSGQRWHRATVARTITEIAYPDLYQRGV